MEHSYLPLSISKGILTLRCFVEFADNQIFSPETARSKRSLLTEFKPIKVSIMDLTRMTKFVSLIHFLNLISAKIFIRVHGWSGDVTSKFLSEPININNFLVRLLLEPQGTARYSSSAVLIKVNEFYLNSVDLMSLQMRMSLRCELLPNWTKGSSWVPTKIGTDMTTDRMTRRIEQSPDIPVVSCCLLGCNV